METVAILLFLILLALAWIGQTLQVIGEEIRQARQAAESVLIDRAAERY